MNKQHYVTTTIIGIALFLISTGLSFAGFSLVSKTEKKVLPSGGILTNTSGSNNQAHFIIDPSVPRTEVCPLNGIMYTKQEKAVWDTRRPIAAMIENHVEARPQSGLSLADIVYESVVEGGITRFEGIFFCGISSRNLTLAPVRSARTFYLPWVLEYDALYNHVGGAGVCSDVTVDERAKALCQIDQYKIKDMDQFGLPLKTTDKSGKKIYVCSRNPDRLGREVATEHTMTCTTDGLYAFAESNRGWTNVDEKGVSWDKNFVPWKFKDEAKTEERGSATSITFSAWKGYEKDYGVRWDYDKATNVYKRFNGGAPHTDLETKQQISAKSIVILYAKETGPVDDHGHLLYNNIGNGDGIFFQDGKSEKITWTKATRNARTKFIDAKGKEVIFSRGQIWIEQLPIGTSVVY